jgi:hypothetical protein
MVGDYYGQKWGQPNTIPNTQPGLGGLGQINFIPNPVTREDFESLKKEVMDMKELLKRAIDYDKKTGQPDCHLEEKLITLRKVAEMVGVSLDDILPGSKPEEK